MTDLLNLLDFETVTSLYLFGTETPPTEVFDRVRGANADPAEINIDAAALMNGNNAVGRYFYSALARPGAGFFKDFFAAGRCLIMRGHNTYFLHVSFSAERGLRPGFWRARVRPVCASRPATKPSSPSGRPVRSPARSASASVSLSPLARKSRHAAGGMPSAPVSVNPSDAPVRCARALDQGQSSGRAASRARTGLSSI